MVRLGKDEEDTHESMQLKRVLNKYDPAKPQRHLGKRRLRHKGDDPLSVPGE